MQCKARRRPCSFSKDGSLEDTADDAKALTEVNEVLYSTPTSSTATVESNDGEERVVNETQEKEKQQRTIHILDTLGATWSGEKKGSAKWMVADLLRVPPRWDAEVVVSPLRASKVQRHLLTLFFRHRYTLFPLVPKRLFYEQLDTNGPLITPLLLYSMYAHGAQFSDDDDDEWFFQQAKYLLDSYLDIPRLSTVISLCLLSLYEPKQSTDHRCRSSLYSSMAFRMSAELSLFKGYLSNHSENVTGYHVELCKRVCWSCYCLDKMQNMMTGQPWLIRGKDIGWDMPLLQPGDDVTEHETLEGFVAYIRLMQICERALQRESSQPSIVRTQNDEQNALSFDNELVHWLQSLPLQLQWTPLPSQINTVPREPPSNAFVAHLHLIYNIVEFYVLQPYANPSAKTAYQRCAAAATNLTQLICLLAEQSNFILSYSLVAHCAMVVIPVHISNCADKDTRFANHARFMFQRTMQGLRQLVQKRTIPGVDRFALSLEQALSATTPPEEEGGVDAFGSDNDKQPWSRLNYFGPDMKHSPKQQATLASIYLNGSEQDAAEVLSCFSSPTSWKQSLDRIQRNPLEFLSVESGWPAAEKPDHEVGSSGVDAYLFKARSLLMPEEKSDQKSATDLLMHHQQKVVDGSSHMATLVDHLGDAGLHKNGPKDHNSNNKEEKRPNWPVSCSSSSSSSHSDALLYSLWPNHQQQRPEQHHQVDEPVAPPPQSQPVQPFFQYQPSYMNIGLGVYASAHQHRNDVISQHFPLMDSRTNPTVRPVILTHHGQVIVAGNNPTTTQPGHASQ
ncbi:hypothetical protein DFQ30_006946 [Apophysomyces sp. BC1015]|nr:hypothetical protein DFQ30_006946 [Apophysomyces sp. BC1015]